MSDKTKQSTFLKAETLGELVNCEIYDLTTLLLVCGNKKIAIFLLKRFRINWVIQNSLILMLTWFLGVFKQNENDISQARSNQL